MYIKDNPSGGQTPRAHHQRCPPALLLRSLLFLASPPRISYILISVAGWLQMTCLDMTVARGRRQTVSSYVCISKAPHTFLPTSLAGSGYLPIPKLVTEEGGWNYPKWLRLIISE